MVTKAEKFLLEAEANEPDLQKVIDDLSNDFKGDFSGIRDSETGNSPGKLYKMTSDKNYAGGSPVALFRVPVITMENNRSTQNQTYDAKNSLQNFSKIFDEIWGLRDKGFIISQPSGGNQKGDYWEDKGKGLAGNIMQFVVGKGENANV